ncbi:protein FAR1-RELATED SEQUENCE 5-like [Abrus precatorius]|uniref:Protein FAR1-RELATED SEQUENCE 5-like n=1 Tax=Abrus precatorius TaxID=3816 RepID=A0A8B8KGS1_ABRPR|nr:protein FAR1-RELATED SEQUENCE 5-like [Abrus precatorius]
MECEYVAWKLRVGLQFNTLEEAWKYWITGFGVRKQYYNRRKVDGVISSCRYVCCKEGHRKDDKRNLTVTKHRAETRTDCLVRITLLLGCNNKYVVHEFVEEHNHPLQLPETTHMLASHRKITEVQAHQIDLAESSGLRQKSSFQLMSTLAGHRANVGYTPLDAKNYLKSKRQWGMLYGEVGYLMEYFQRQLIENPSFFHAYQMDVEEQITNVFWADAKMVIDYGCFGEVISLDTTYCTNRANRPLTAESFKWLFETFLEAHNQKQPQTIFTDQDQAMAKAIVQVMPHTHHALCTWHLMQNGIKHLGNLMRGETHFLRDLKKCMYDYDSSIEFEGAWRRFITEYNEKWASCYLKDVFTLGMRSTQLSESLNSDFKACMKSGVDIKQFFAHFERVVEDKRYNELKHEYDSRHKLAILQYEFAQFLACNISQRFETPPIIEYVITKVHQQRSWTVTFEPSSSTIYCSCKKFETFGILCCHASKVFEANDVKVIPDKYILKRWTTQGRSEIIHNVKGKEVKGDPKLSTTRRYRNLACKIIRLASDVSSSEEYYQLVDDSINNLISKITKLQLQTNSLMDKDKDDAEFMANNDGTQPKGFKRRPSSKRKGSKRFKSWVELQAKRKKSRTPILDQSTSQEYQPVVYDPVEEQLHDTNDSILDDI